MQPFTEYFLLIWRGQHPNLEPNSYMDVLYVVTYRSYY